MIIRSVKFQSGQKLPVLFRQDPYQPAFVSFLYSVLYLKNKAVSTGFNSLHLIKSLYEHAEKDGQDLDELLVFKKLDKIIDYSDRLIFDLDSSRELTPSTRNAYLNDLMNFLIWCSTRYSHGKYNALLKEKIDSYRVKASTYKNNIKSLSEAEENILREFAFPSSEKNPFRSNCKFRNWLIIEIFLQTGLRLSELLKVCASDVQRLGDNYYILIRDTPEKSLHDSRAKEPSLKNSLSERTLSISEEVYVSLEHYIKNLRRPIRDGKPLKLNHGFVFVSERGSPLAKTTVAEMINTLNAAIKSSNKAFPEISPHTFRHTFADRFLSNLIDFQGYDMERAKDILRSYCGWSMNSPMPVFYAKRYIAVTANRENINRIENSKRRFKSSVE